MSVRAATARSLSKCLTAPSKVAQALDWKKASGSILSLRVNDSSIDIAVAAHPSFEESAHQLQPIPLVRKTLSNRKVVSDTVADALQKVVKDYNVCGMVVSWPVQREGWCGAPCGRVLNALDQIQLTSDRPVCLYDVNHCTPPEDEWGRSEIYSTTCDKTVHVASQEQYQDCTGKVASEIWKDFCHEHWPEFAQDESSTPSSRKDLVEGHHDDSLWLHEGHDAYNTAYF
jgi:hypothetical protein